MTISHLCWGQLRLWGVQAQQRLLNAKVRGWDRPERLVELRTYLWEDQNRCVLFAKKQDSWWISPYEYHGISVTIISVETSPRSHWNLLRQLGELQVASAQVAEVFNSTNKPKEIVNYPISRWFINQVKMKSHWFIIYRCYSYHGSAHPFGFWGDLTLHDGVSLGP